MSLSGFYEGSVIFGNRFKDTNFNALRVLDNIKPDDVVEADEFVRANLGLILHNDSAYYSKLYSIKEPVKRELRLAGHPYFYQVDNGKFISQARMSTGENLLITILHSLNLRRYNKLKFDDGRPFIVFLDEIELALHASSLRRLLLFLRQISDEMNAAIFFSTHSLELIRDIKAQNIFYLDRQLDGSIMITNPCYPAYATRNLYSDDGYGNDAVIFVEDDLAKCILERVLIEKDLINNIRIKILPTGGWTNTLVMAHDVISSKLLLRGTKVIVVLDKDIQPRVPDFMSRHKECKYLEPDYLPVSSLEKYLKQNLVDQVDTVLYIDTNFVTNDSLLLEKERSALFNACEKYREHGIQSKAAYLTFCEDIYKLMSQLADKKHELMLLKKEIGSFNEEAGEKIIRDIARLETKKDEATERKTRTKVLYEQAQESLAEWEAQLAKYSQTDSEGKLCQRKLETTVQLEKVFSSYKEQLLEQKRCTVEEYATAVFREITNAPQKYKGIKIDSDYSLLLELTNGETYQIEPGRTLNPSTGQSKVISLSYIAGLNKSSNYAAPVIIDNPLGLFSDEHRTAITKYLPHFSKQVIFMVSTGDLTEKYRDILSPYIKAEYYLANESSGTWSKTTIASREEY